MPRSAPNSKNFLTPGRIVQFAIVTDGSGTPDMIVLDDAGQLWHREDFIAQPNPWSPIDGPDWVPA